MNRQRLINHEMLTRVVSVGKRNINLFPRDSVAEEILRAMESDLDSLTEITNAALSSDTAVRVASKSRAAARQELNDLLVRASGMCRELESPQLQLPRQRMTDQVLLTVGCVFVADAEPIKAEFARYGLRIEDIATAVHTFEGAVIDFTNAKAVHATAAQKWSATLSDALRKVRRFDLLVKNVLKDNPIATSEYEVARFVPKPVVRKKEAATVDAPPPATPAPTAA